MPRVTKSFRPTSTASTLDNSTTGSLDNPVTSNPENQQTSNKAPQPSGFRPAPRYGNNGGYQNPSFVQQERDVPTEEVSGI